MSGAIERVVFFDGCFNFRDLGGYKSYDGREVRRATLFRADTLHRLTNDDIGRSLGLRTVIDLRSTKEIDDFGALPLDAHPPEGRHHIPMMDVVDLRAVRVDPRPAELEPPEVVYNRIFGSGAAVVRAIDVLAGEGALPAVFHCTAGKDRTGILAAILLDVLGVPDADIITDYDLTSAGRERSLNWMTQHEPDMAVLLRRASPEMESRGRTGLVALMSSLRKTHGSLQGALIGLGVLPDSLDRLRSALLI